ncbi:MAG TPA: lipoyl(octanoyl) transferase LipB [Rhodothermales bacterium]|nr:lipoyl(octanoyl) transferase LipB [Rhodothermales bacterium]
MSDEGRTSGVLEKAPPSLPSSLIPHRSSLVVDLGRVGYDEAWALQRRIQGALVAAKRAVPPVPLPHVVLLVEHPPVFTLGPSGDEANVLASADDLAARGATFVRTDRGGDVTFHGPGQLVAYPILDLDRIVYPDGGRGTDIHRYLRTLEEAVIDTCADHGVVAGRVAGRTGVWVGPDEKGPERKVCAMGIRCSRWVTMHGLAFNLNTDLNWFGLIVPCGITDRGVTSLAVETGGPVNEAEVRTRFTGHLLDRLGLDGTFARSPETWLAEADAALAVETPSPLRR